MEYEKYMRLAHELARQAYTIDEVPIGAVIVLDDQVIGQGYNRRNIEKNVLYHAEMIAIDQACKSINDWRLEGATLFVSVEPCAMCAGAILQSRLKEVVFSISNEKFGACGSVVNVLNVEKFNHQVSVVSGVLEEEARQMMKSFFRTKREQKQSRIGLSDKKESEIK